MIAVRLLHGRKTKNEHLEDWGDNGPTLGPFDQMHVTYGHVRLIEADGTDHDLIITEDLAYYDGVYYGDYIVISEDVAVDDMLEMQKFDDKKGKLPV